MKTNPFWSGAFLPLESVRRDFLNGVSRATGTNAVVPAAVYEQDEHLTLAFDLPGFAEEDVELTFEKGRLHVKAERKPVEGLGECRLDERSYGSFERAFRLGDDIDPDAIEATLEHGVLTVRLARRPETRTRKVAINAK